MPQLFAIDGDYLPANKAGLELLRVQAGKQLRKGVVRRDAIGQLQKRPKPFKPGFAELFHVFPVIGSRNHRTNGNDQNIQQLGPVYARIGQIAKVLFKGR